MTITLNLKLSF